MADIYRRPSREPDLLEDERRQLPAERSDRATRRHLVLGLMVAVVAHMLFFSGCVGLLMLLIPLHAPPPPEPPPESMPIVFMPKWKPPRKPEPPQPTNQISDVNSRAESPGPKPPQAHGDTVVRREGPTGPPREVTPSPPPEPQEPEPETPKEPAETAQDRPLPESADARRARLADALHKLGGNGDWGSLASGDGKGSTGLGYDYGGSDFQIESNADVDWGPWSHRVQQIVKGNWYDVMPVAARVGMKGVVRVRFVVHRDGELTDFETLDSSGLEPLDTAVHTALVRLSNPLPPLPLPEGGEDTIRITYTFIYNLEDEREMRAWQRQRWMEQRRSGGG